MEYSFRNKKTGKVQTFQMKLAEYDDFKEKNPHLERWIQEPALMAYNQSGDFRGKQTDNTWKEVLSKIAEQNPRTPLGNEYRKRGIKEIKTNSIIEKHVKKQKEQQNKK
jgi:hypothetical protein